MEWLPAAPAVVLVAFSLAAALFLVEVALPTVGVAGTSSLVLAVWAFAVMNHNGYAWWPLLFVGAAVCTWAALLARKRASPAAQTVAAALFLGGSLTYGLLAEDIASVVLAAAASVALPVGFRPLLGATQRLLDLPHQTGMESLVGRTGEVVSWNGGRGKVRIDGSLWNATGPAKLPARAEVRVDGFDRMTVRVALPATIP